MTARTGLLRDERLPVLLALIATVAIALALTMQTGAWLMASGTGTRHSLLLFLMWFSMMAAMMLPSATPAILLFRTMDRRLGGPSGSAVRLAAFTGGYLAIWGLFSFAMVTLQLITAPVIGVTGMMAVTSSLIGGALLLAAGLWQFTPIKQSCLTGCQSPFHYLSHNWRKGVSGAFLMGLGHGRYCLGCCWVLMGLLLYGGVMEPLWIVGIAAYVAAEKLSPPQYKISQFSGLILIVWGTATIALAAG